MSPVTWKPTLALTELSLPWLARAEVQVQVLRLDAIDPLISGNKWFKLKPYLEQAARLGACGLISLGGAHSNHLHALAAAGQRFGFNTVGLLRGHAQITPTVQDLTAMGMQLHWLGYQGYRARHADDFLHSWQALYPNHVCIDEGGLGLDAAHSCSALVGEVQRLLAGRAYDGWWLGAGTGTTLAGLVLAERGRVPVHGVLAVPIKHGVPENIAKLLAGANCANDGYSLHDGSLGGFAKVTPALLEFMARTEQQAGLKLDPVYTAKALLALKHKVEAGLFTKGARLIFVHTGGLQGRRSVSDALAAIGPVIGHQ